MDHNKSGTMSADSTKTVLHFSDGIMEVVDLEHTAPAMSQCDLDPKQLDWAPWSMHMTKKVGSKTLEVCDYLGESLASFFGITTPKYQFEINEYHRMIKAKEEAQKEKDLEMGSWANGNVASETILSPPKALETKANAAVAEGLRF